MLCHDAEHMVMCIVADIGETKFSWLECCCLNERVAGCALLDFDICPCHASSIVMLPTCWCSWSYANDEQDLLCSTAMQLEQ
jgi:hypothetical protein